VGVWTDRALGGAFGAVGRPGEWQAMFWVDEGGMRHPDARFPVGRTLAPGERWEAGPMPYLWVFGTRDADGWRAVARLCRQAGSLR
jgi:hypothetical protein